MVPGVSKLTDAARMPGGGQCACLPWRLPPLGKRRSTKYVHVIKGTTDTAKGQKVRDNKEHKTTQVKDNAVENRILSMNNILVRDLSVYAWRSVCR
jgi:hypothetical protein